MPERDANDKVVSNLILKIREILLGVLPSAVYEKDSPIGFTLNNEIGAFKSLIDVILESVDEFLNFIDGQEPMPAKCEILWLKIQNNKIPQRWLQASYNTAHKSLAHYLADFVEKLNFWN